MRILHLDAGREMGGGQWQVLRLIGGLAAAGVDSTLLARAGFPLYDAARKQGFRVAAIGLTRAVMLSRRHDLIHAHDAHGHTLGSIIRSARLLVSRRVAFPIGKGHISSKWKYARAVHYIAVSEFVKTVLVQGGVPAEKISVVYDGVPVLEYRAAPEKILYVSKGTSIALEAAKVAGVHMQLAGNLENDLRDTGIFVYVTQSEGLGSGVLMAMSAGAAVVASNVGGLTEVIRHRRDGLLVDNTPDAFAAGIRELLDKPAMAKELGQEARRTVADRFTVDRMVSRTMDTYRQVLA